MWPIVTPGIAHIPVGRLVSSDRTQCLCYSSTSQLYHVSYVVCAVEPVVKGSVQWQITYAFYCLDMFIWSYYAQNNTFNNIIMVNI